MCDRLIIIKQRDYIAKCFHHVMFVLHSHVLGILINCMSLLCNTSLS